jgi:hypothetical protein
MYVCVLCVGAQDARAQEQRASGTKGSKEASSAQQLAAIKREESTLTQQANDIASQVRRVCAWGSRLIMAMCTVSYGGTGDSLSCRCAECKHSSFVIGFSTGFPS